MKRFAAAMWRRIRRWPKTSVSAVALFALGFLPVWPYFPECWDEGFDQRYIFRYMSHEYRTLLKHALDTYGIYHWDIGGILFIHVHGYFDDDDAMFRPDAFANADGGVAATLSDRDYDGKEIGGRLYRVPAFIRELEANYSGEISSPRSCAVMPYIVSMKPPSGWSAK